MQKYFRKFSIVETLVMVTMLAMLALLIPHTGLALGVVGGGFTGMIIDAQCVLSDAQALVATAVSTNTYDSGAAGNDVTIGEPLCLAFTVDIAAKVSNADETYQIQAIQSAAADLSAQDVLISTDTAFMPRGFFTAGKKFYIPLPPGSKTKRYLGARYVLGGTNPTMTISCDIKPLSMIQNDYINASGFKITS